MDIIVYVGVVISLTQVLKTAFGISTRYIPLVALLIGALFFGVAYLTGVTTINYQDIMNAIVGIFSAMGLYSSVKAVSGN